MDAVHRFFAELTESALLGCLEPEPIAFTRQHEKEISRVQTAIHRAKCGTLVRFRSPVNRNGFLRGCLEYTELRPEEHLVLGYGYRHGSTTKIDSLHHAIGASGSVTIPTSMAHAMWEHYGRDDGNELILFHNHPRNLASWLLDTPPLAWQADRDVLKKRALNPEQLLRTLLGQGRVLFFLGENGWVKQFRLPNLQG
jgi:hypothetical protein